MTPNLFFSYYVLIQIFIFPFLVNFHSIFHPFPYTFTSIMSSLSTLLYKFKHFPIVSTIHVNILINHSLSMYAYSPSILYISHTPSFNNYPLALYTHFNFQHFQYTSPATLYSLFNFQHTKILPFPAKLFTSPATSYSFLVNFRYKFPLSLYTHSHFIAYTNASPATLYTLLTPALSNTPPATLYSFLIFNIFKTYPLPLYTPYSILYLLQYHHFPPNNSLPLPLYTHFLSFSISPLVTLYSFPFIL